MRPIKFRAWEDGRMSNPFTIFNVSDDLGRTYINDFGKVYNPVLMQFTGLLDKNGKEIYEGDILKSEDGERFKVWFDRGLFGAWKHEEFYLSLTVLLDLHPLEVVGNIYEHPELLGKKEEL